MIDGLLIKCGEGCDPPISAVDSAPDGLRVIPQFQDFISVL